MWSYTYYQQWLQPLISPQESLIASSPGEPSWNSNAPLYFFHKYFIHKMKRLPLLFFCFFSFYRKLWTRFSDILCLYYLLLLILKCYLSSNKKCTQEYISVSVHYANRYRRDHIPLTTGILFWKLALLRIAISKMLGSAFSPLYMKKWLNSIGIRQNKCIHIILGPSSHWAQSQSWI